MVILYLAMSSRFAVGIKISCVLEISNAIAGVRV